MQTTVSDDSSSFANRHKRVKFVHYYSSPWVDAQTGTPRPLMIGVRDFVTGKLDLFAVHTLAELRGFEPSEILGKLDQLEKGILEAFYESIQVNRKMRWVHWGMEGPVWGFPALAHRFRALGGRPPEIPAQRQINLAAALKLTYGAQYAPNPRLPSLAEMNGVNVHGWLWPLEDLQAATRAAEYTRMTLSLGRQLNVIAEVFALFVTGKLRHRGDPSLTCPLRSLMLTSSQWPIPPCPAPVVEGQRESTGARSAAQYTTGTGEGAGSVPGTSSEETSLPRDECPESELLTASARSLRENGMADEPTATWEPLPPSAALPSSKVEERTEGDGSSGSDQAEQGGPEEQEWLTVSEAARVATTNSGTITRAVENGEIRSNGKRGRDRRIDPAGLSHWMLSRANRPEPQESEEQVKRLINKHCGR